MSHTREEIDHHVRTYIRVFVTLMVMTVLTVAVAKFKLAHFWAIAIALGIASFKGSLVAGFFMHLKTERRIIFAFLILTAVLFIFLMALPTLVAFDPIEVTHES